MAENLSYNVEDLHTELVERAREAGVTTQEAWNEMVEEVLDEHLNWGEIDIDDDVTSIREALQSRWTQFDEGLQAGEIAEG